MRKRYAKSDICPFLKEYTVESFCRASELFLEPNTGKRLLNGTVDNYMEFIRTFNSSPKGN